MIHQAHTSLLEACTEAVDPETNDGVPGRSRGSNDDVRDKAE